MATLSFRSSLAQIGEPRTGQSVPAWPGGFHCSPRTLKRALLAMRVPRVNEWTVFAVANKFENFKWTEECNGVTSDGHFWYFASSNADGPGIYKFTLDFNYVAKAGLPKGTHIGDIDFFGGRIFAPLEPAPKRIAVLDTSLALLSVVELQSTGDGGAPHTSNSWCALNPLNGLLYGSNFDAVDRVYCYDPDTQPEFAYRGALKLHGPPVGGVQGGAFTENGHLYLASDTYAGKSATKDIRAYSSLNGEFLGSKQVPYDTNWKQAEEMEGFAILDAGGLGQIHIVILDNDWPSSDDVFLKHLIVPDLAVL